MPSVARSFKSSGEGPLEVTLMSTEASSELSLIGTRRICICSGAILGWGPEW